MSFSKEVKRIWINKINISQQYKIQYSIISQFQKKKNPALFKAIYFEFIYRKRDEQNEENIENHMDE